MLRIEVINHKTDNFLENVENEEKTYSDSGVVGV